MPSFQFQSNLPIILLIIVIALISLYFFLDLKKNKTCKRGTRKKKMIWLSKKIDNIHLRLHKFFSGMPKGIVPHTEIPSGVTHVKPDENTEVNESIDAVESDKVQKTNPQPHTRKYLRMNLIT